MTTFSLTFPIGEGRTFTIADGSPNALCDAYSKVGGDGASLKQVIKSAAADPSLNAPKEIQVTAPSATANTPNTTTAAEPSGDPWADDPGPAAPADDDPWGADPNESSATPSASSAKPSAPSGSSLNVTRDNFGREWTTGLPNAPTCECGEPAAKMKAKAQATKKTYVQWRCARAATTDNWQNKCNFKEFPS